MLQLEAIEGLTIYGPRPERGRASLCSFNVEGVHPTDISTLLDANGEQPTNQSTAWSAHVYAR